MPAAVILISRTDPGTKSCLAEPKFDLPFFSRASSRVADGASSPLQTSNGQRSDGPADGASWHKQPQEPRSDAGQRSLKAGPAAYQHRPPASPRRTALSLAASKAASGLKSMHLEPKANNVAPATPLSQNDPRSNSHPTLNDTRRLDDRRDDSAASARSNVGGRPTSQSPAVPQYAHDARSNHPVLPPMQRKPSSPPAKHTSSDAEMISTAKAHAAQMASRDRASAPDDRNGTPGHPTASRLTYGVPGAEAVDDAPLPATTDDLPAAAANEREGEPPTFYHISSEGFVPIIPRNREYWEPKSHVANVSPLRQLMRQERLADGQGIDICLLCNREVFVGPHLAPTRARRIHFGSVDPDGFSMQGECEEWKQWDDKCRSKFLRHEQAWCAGRQVRQCPSGRARLC